MKFNCNDDEDSEHAELLLLLAKVAHLAGDEDRRLKNKNKRVGTRLDAPTVPRQRRSVTQVYREMGAGYFRRSFRMTFRTFRRLYRLLEPYLKKARGGSNQDDPDYVERSPNGSIPLTVRLACMLRFFAGGKAYDISVMFGIVHLSVFESIDCVINAVNQCGEMEIEFLSSHDKQRNIADRIYLKSPLADIS